MVYKDTMNLPVCIAIKKAVWLSHRNLTDDSHSYSKYRFSGYDRLHPTRKTPRAIESPTHADRNSRAAERWKNE